MNGVGVRQGRGALFRAAQTASPVASAGASSEFRAGWNVAHAGAFLM
jgi:hypothetical protein